MLHAAVLRAPLKLKVTKTEAKWNWNGSSGIIWSLPTKVLTVLLVPAAVSVAMSQKGLKNQTANDGKTKDGGPQVYVKLSGRNYGSQIGINNGSIEQYILDGRVGKSRHTELSEWAWRRKS